MATTHVVFLPYTINFHENPGHERRQSPPLKAPSRAASGIDLPTRPSTASLFTGPTPPLTPNAAAAEEFFSQMGPQTAGLHATPGNPRSLLRSDAHVPEWGAQAIFNQPRSRAGPLPSGSILDFAKVHEELQKKRERERTKRTSPKGHARTAGNGSTERGFESWTVEPAVQGNGGLTNAIRALTETVEADVTWVGTLGFPTDSLSDSTKEDIYDSLLNEYQSHAVYLSDKDLDGHYAHYCKTILWPIFNYQVPDHPKSKAYADHSWGFYKSLNQAFADKVVASHKRGDVIWVHDYHLLLVPGMIRQKLPDAQIGFFLHTAFPSSEVFRCLATRKELLEGMLGANLIAFQTEEYVTHFLQTCSRILTVETVAEGVQLEDHFVNVTAEPIGINPTALEEARQAREVREWMDVIQEKYKDKFIIVARDKLDHIRGVRQKLLAYELFLNKYPEYREKVILIQVATSTSEQSELMTTVADICTRIDSVHSTLAHQPLVFLKQDIAFSQYLALLTAADALMISSLRDGMNLTAHEFIYCQDGKGGPKKHGPLILSEFTGSASVFGNNHLSINPWDYQAQADAIKKALLMSNEEKTARWKAMHDVVLKQTGGTWSVNLTNALARVHNEHGRRDSTAIPRLSMGQITESYKNANHRVFILDYEGTLAPHRTSSGLPLSSPQRVLDALSDISSDPKNIIYIMSGRCPEEMETSFRTLPNIGLIAENGCFMREYGSQDKEWISFPDMDSMDNWKSAVKGILKYYHERLDGSYIEERHCSLLFRFDKVEDEEAAARTAGECADHINGACNKMRVRAVPINKAVLIETLDWSKGTAAAEVLEKNRQIDEQKGGVCDFLMVAGDDREDEVIFRWANELGKSKHINEVFTVSVGKRNTEAHYTLTQGTTGLLTVLGKLAKISADALPTDYFNVKGR